MANRIILINGSGFKSGKDTAASFIRDQIIENDIHNKGRIVIKGMFAHNLKKYVGSISGEEMVTECPRKWANAYEDFTQEQKDMIIPAFGMSLGKMLQIIGTEGLREGFAQDVHVIGEASRLSEILKYFPGDIDKTIMFSDWRFQNEGDVVDHIRELTGEIWDAYYIQVRRDSVDRSTDSRSMTHKSEVEELDYNHEISNNSTLGDLKIDCEAFVNDFIEY